MESTLEDKNEHKTNCDEFLHQYLDDYKKKLKNVETDNKKEIYHQPIGGW